MSKTDFDIIIEGLEAFCARQDFEIKERTREIQLLLRKKISDASNQDSQQSYFDTKRFQGRLSNTELSELSRREKRVIISNYRLVHRDNVYRIMENESQFVTVFVKTILSEWPEHDYSLVEPLLKKINLDDIVLPSFLPARSLVAVLAEPSAMAGIISEVDFSKHKNPIDFFNFCTPHSVSKFSHFVAHLCGLCLFFRLKSSRADPENEDFIRHYEEIFLTSENSDGRFKDINAANASRFSPYICSLLIHWVSGVEAEKNRSKLERLVRPGSMDDPRLPEGSRRWKIVEELLPNEFEAFRISLNQADISLFFEHVNMDERRRDFWIQFVPIMKSVQVLLDAVAFADLKRRIGTDEKWLNVLRRIKQMSGNSDKSILILEIGSMFVAEGSHTGAACHIFTAAAYYDAVFPLINYPSRVQLKNYTQLREQWRTQKDFGRVNFEEHYVTHVDGWEQKIEMLLGLRGLLKTRSSKQSQAQAARTNPTSNSFSTKVKPDGVRGVPSQSAARILSGPVLRFSRDKIVDAKSKNQIGSLLSDGGFKVEDLRAKGKGLWVEDCQEFRDLLSLFLAAGIRFEFVKLSDSSEKRDAWRMSA